MAPNPFSSTATISFSKELNNVEIAVSDMYGKVVMQQNAQHCKKFVLQRSDLAPGVYFYVVKENGIVVGKDKVIVQ